MTLSRLVAVIAILLFAATIASAEEPASFVGAQACAGCHAAQAAAWQPSHHALAMQPAAGGAVLGDFSGAKLEHFGVVTTFFRDRDRYMVRTEGPDGALHDYEIAYTFGVDPLQQYLIAMPGGRLQALGIAWDSRPKAEGGQRWYHLYPDQRLPPGDRLHWTGRDQTWNYMCADCHSTGVVKNFDLRADTYKTTWTDLNVGCESCHGPGSRHMAWAQSGGGASEQDHKGLVAWLKPTDHGRWEMNEATGIAHRTEKLASAELDSCAGCHARRKVIASASPPAAPFLDTALPAYLEPGLYHADGQIDGEVFEYGSFVQSRMFHAGVTCSNCHEPHSLSLRAEGNALCAQCHMPAKFDVSAHHHHEPGTAGAQCANCHMPAKTYMGVDVRHDHSFRVPRPDLSAATGTPNTCTQCHTDRDAAWAARAVAEWYPNGRQTTTHYGTALHAGRAGAADAETQLDRVILDPTVPAIARGSAVLLLRAYLSNGSKAAVTQAAADPDPIIRAAVPRMLPAALSPAMVQGVAPLLKDPVRAVRIETARALAGLEPQSLAPEQRAALSAAYLELVAAEQIDRDRPEAHLNIGLLNNRRRQPDLAEAEYRTALRLDPNFVPALANLADLERVRGRDQRGAELLRKAVEIEPANADARHALGLLLVRQRDYTGALAQLKQASELAPGNARYAYVYAVALNSSGASSEAAAAMEQAHARHPADRDILAALIGFARGRGDREAATGYARKLVKLDPANIQARALVQELERTIAQ